ncbi:MAG: hypothetical protein ABEK12_01095, partial [Candidatus Nanohaloarchaea archaeon]
RDRRDELDRLLTDRYDAVERMERLEDLVDRYDRLCAERDDVVSVIDEIDIAAHRSSLEEAEADLEGLRESDTWAEYQDLQAEKEQAEAERREARRAITAAAGKMERGLKKLICAVEHGDRETDADLTILRDIRDGDIDSLLDRDADAVAAAARAARDALPPEMLGDRQQEKFDQGVERLADIGDLAQRIDRLDDRTAELEEDLSGHEAVAREAELEERIDELEDRIESAAERR